MVCWSFGSDQHTFHTESQLFLPTQVSHNLNFFKIFTFSNAMNINFQRVSVYRNGHSLHLFLLFIFRTHRSTHHLFCFIFRLFCRAKRSSFGSDVHFFIISFLSLDSPPILMNTNFACLLLYYSSFNRIATTFLLTVRRVICNSFVLCVSLCV